MKRTMCRYGFLVCVLVSMLTPFAASAQDTSTTPSNAADGLRVGILLSQVSLLGDPGESGANALGWGLESTYRIEPSLAIALRYLMSGHSNVDHKEINLGLEYSIGEYESAFPYAVGGLAFHDNRLKAIDRSGGAAGVYVGLGADFNIVQNFWIAPEIRFTKIFPSRIESNGRSIDTVSDSYTFGLRGLYAF